VWFSGRVLSYHSRGPGLDLQHCKNKLTNKKLATKRKEIVMTKAEITEAENRKAVEKNQ
jgi:hypothetical protein